MAKTKTLGIRVTPDLNGELERLKEAFGFDTYGEMLESFVRLLRAIDEGVCNIEKHPVEWGESDVAKYLPSGDGNLAGYQTKELAELLWRRLKQRFGEDGVERVQQLLSQYSPAAR